MWLQEPSDLSHVWGWGIFIEVVGLSGRGPGFHDCKEKMLNCLGCYLKVTCSFISCLSKPVLFFLAANSPAVNSAGERGVEPQSWLHRCNKFQISTLTVVVALCGSWWVPCCKKVIQIWEPWVYWSVNLCFVPQLAKCLSFFFGGGGRLWAQREWNKALLQWADVQCHWLTRSASPGCWCAGAC